MIWRRFRSRSAGVIENDGFQIVRSAVGEDSCAALRELLGVARGAGTRHLLEMPEIKALASNVLASLVRPSLPATPVPVRSIYFDKTPETNWAVAWHQDLTIAVQRRHETEGFGPWSIKDGVPHVQPPVKYLQQMLTARLHLDDTDESNGALRVLPGSHRHGRLDAAAIRQWRVETPEIVCAAKAGDVLLMRPLLLHASSKAIRPGRRRIIHIEFASFHLPAPLRWSEDKYDADQDR